MSKPLAHFAKGQKVAILCYRKSCGQSLSLATLGQEEKKHPSCVRRGGVGRLYWYRKATVKVFTLQTDKSGSGYHNCPICNKLFGRVVVVSHGRGRPPTIFGYKPNPA